jgi:hypothetical protein
VSFLLAVWALELVTRLRARCVIKKIREEVNAAEERASAERRQHFAALETQLRALRGQVAEAGGFIGSGRQLRTGTTDTPLTPAGRGRARVFITSRRADEPTVPLGPPVSGDGEDPVATAYLRGRTDEREAISIVGQPPLRIVES